MPGLPGTEGTHDIQCGVPFSPGALQAMTCPVRVEVNARKDMELKWLIKKGPVGDII